MVSRTLRIATRKSQLALWQAEAVRQRLQQAHPGLDIELLPLSTQGDRILDAPLAKIGGKGLFVKELEQAMLRGDADLAVHSMKDVPVELPAGLHIPTVLAREDPRDALVCDGWSGIDELPQGARVGTSSLRRRCQLAALRPDLVIEDLRGNVNTRLAKLADGAYDAILLAGAGLLRLGLAQHIAALLEPDVMLPAIGQGAIGVECREDDGQLHAWLAPLNDTSTQVRVQAERALNAALQGGCQVPIGGYAELGHGVIVLRGLIGSASGAAPVQGVISGRPEDADELGQVLANDLLTRGGAELLAQWRAAADAD